jgi:HEAT repeat protein
LLEVLESEKDPVLQHEALAIVHQTACSDALPQVRRLALEPSPDPVRVAAVRALGEVGAEGDAEVPILEAAMSGHSWVLRSQGILAVARLRAQAAEASVIERLTDRNRTVRLSAAEALRDMGTAESLEPMKQAAARWRFFDRPAQHSRCRAIEERLGRTP